MGMFHIGYIHNVVLEQSLDLEITQGSSRDTEAPKLNHLAPSIFVKSYMTPPRTPRSNRGDQIAAYCSGVPCCEHAPLKA